MKDNKTSQIGGNDRENKNDNMKDNNEVLSRTYNYNISFQAFGCRRYKEMEVENFTDSRDRF